MDIATALDEHLQWVTSLGAEGRQLSEMDLDLRGVNLAKRVLSEAEVPGSNFDGAQLSDADLFASNLASATFRASDLSRAVLTKANADYSNFENADLTNVKAFRTSLVSASLRGAVLRDADLRHADLTDADLSAADLRGACLDWANLTGTRLVGAQLAGVTGLETVIVDSLLTSPSESLTGDAAKSWLLERAKRRDE